MPDSILLTNQDKAFRINFTLELHDIQLVGKSMLSPLILISNNLVSFQYSLKEILFKKQNIYI